MNTVVVELRHDPDQKSLLSMVIDDLNDILVHLAKELQMDILSISHSHHFYEHKASYSCTCVFLRNEQTAESIAAFVGQSDSVYAFNDAGKASLVVHERRFRSWHGSN